LSKGTFPTYKKGGFKYLKDERGIHVESEGRGSLDEILISELRYKLTVYIEDSVDFF
jgi:hypothetical protein